MKKSLALFTATIALSGVALGACSSVPRGIKVPTAPAASAAAQVASPSAAVTAAVAAAPANARPALARFTNDTAALSAVEEQAINDAGLDNVPGFTSDCKTLTPQGAAWNAEIASIYKNFPGALSPVTLDPSSAQLTLAEIMVACGPYV
jgi:hypothetical protein